MSFLSEARKAFGSKRYDDYDEYDEYEDYDDEDYEDEDEPKGFFSGLFSKKKKGYDEDTDTEVNTKSTRSSSYTSPRTTYGSTSSYRTAASGYSSARASSSASSTPSVRLSGTGMQRPEIFMLYVDEFERSAEAVREVKKGKIVIIDVTELDPNIARRVVDYISGAAEGLESKCQRVSGGIFCLAPAGTTFTLKRAPGTRQQSSVK